MIDYNLVTIVLTRDFEVVVAAEIDDARGLYQLETYPLDALGVAQVSEWENGVKSNMVLNNEVVGLRLKNGGWELVNEWENFGGICRKGELPRDNISALALHYWKKLSND